ncbi:hypothetical protein FQN57_003207 [Myotisia sp. PD_48]|nr:hypothetical protein FQN57_003207 [Myotisia sp. PD_48]
MGRLPPAEKLPLSVRKNVRDEWESNKPDLENQLSELLSEAWTIDINPSAIWPYHNDGYAKDSLGSCIKAYVEGVQWQLKSIINKYGDDVKSEINTICHARVITLDYDEEKRFSYCGCDVADGKLRIFFADGYLGTNIDDAAAESNLFPALNAAPSDKPLSFIARTGIRQDWDPEAAGIQKQLAEILNKPDFKVTPNFEDIFKKLETATKKGGSGIREDWQSVLGSYVLKYFEGAVYQLKYQKFNEDDMLQEGFNEAVEKGEIAVRIVDELESGYCECKIEDGVLYLQCTAENFGVNIDDAAAKIMDLL